MLLASACSSGDRAVDSPVASVNGVDLTAEVVDEVIQATLEVPAGSLSIATSESSGVLDLLIQVELVRQALADEGITPTEEDRQAAAESIYAQFGTDPNTGVVDLEAGQDAFEELDPVLQEAYLDQQMLGDAITATVTDEEAGIQPVTDEEVQAAYEAGLGELTSRCLSYILIDPELDSLVQQTQADELVDRLEAGESMDDLVAEVNEGRDPTQPLGAEFGCTTRAEMEAQVSSEGFPMELYEAIWAAEGVGPVGPVAPAAGGVFVFNIDSEEVTPLADVEEDIRSQLDAANDDLRNRAVGGRVAELALAADVWIDPKYGRWVTVDEVGVETTDVEAAVGAGVLPPQGPQDPPVDPDDTLPLDPFGGGGVPVSP